MVLTSGLRRFALTAHVVVSVGWLGAVVGFFVLAIVGARSPDIQRVRAAYLSMELTGWFALVPLSVTSLMTGLVQSLGTKWGLFRHHWVLAKLVINVLASIILLMYMQTLGFMADVATRTTLSSSDLRVLQNPTAVLHAGGALVALLVATALAVYKPRGMTRYGRRKQREQRTVSHS